MTTPEPMLVVPLSKLVRIVKFAVTNRWKWHCQLSTSHACLPDSRYSSRAEAESAAIAHLADVHGLTVAAEEAGEAAARKLIEIAEHVRDAIRHHHQYDHLDQEVIDDLGESSRQLRLIAAEVARLRSAGDGAADGAELIVAERFRQVAAEGWTADHDDQHERDDLVLAARSYLIGERFPGRPPAIWPWEREAWKPCPGDRVRELVKAGALIAAEIDRLQRMADR